MSRRRSEEIARRAQEVLDELSPDQRRELDEMAREMARRRAGTPNMGDLDARETESLDARAPDERAQERTVAEWFSDEPPPQDAIVRRDDLATQVEQAARGAQEAIEARRISPRYEELLRRVYRRVQRDRDGS